MHRFYSKLRELSEASIDRLSELSKGEIVAFSSQDCPASWRVYMHKLGSSTVRALCFMYRYFNENEPIHIAKIAPPEIMRSRAWSLAAHWGLVVEVPDPTNHDKRRSGWWMLTTKGRMFAANKLAVPSHAFFLRPGDYFLKFNPLEYINAFTILEHPRSAFSYSELMHGTNYLRGWSFEEDESEALDSRDKT